MKIRHKLAAGFSIAVLAVAVVGIVSLVPLWFDGSVPFETCEGQPRKEVP